MRQGVRDYFIKPVTREELFTVLRKSVDQHIVLKDQFATSKSYQSRYATTP